MGGTAACAIHWLNPNAVWEKKRTWLIPIGQQVTTATSRAGEVEVFESQVPAASWPTAHNREAQTRIFPSPLPNGPTGPGVCICIPGELFRMLQTLFNKCGSVAGTGSDAMVGSQMAFFMWRIVEGLGHYMSTISSTVSFPYCAIFDTLLRLDIPLT